MMIKKFFKKYYILFLVSFIFFQISNFSHAGLDLNNLVAGKMGLAEKDKELKNFFSNNEITISMNNQEKKYKFDEKQYELYQNDKVIEKGKWKIGGLFKNYIQLTTQDKKKYYLKKISQQPLIYHYDKVPGSEKAIETKIEIKLSSKLDISIENDNSDNSNLADNKNDKNNSKKNDINTIYYQDENSIHIKGKMFSQNYPAKNIAGEHCSKYNKNAYLFDEDWKKGKKSSILFYCSEKYLAKSPVSGKKLIYSNDPIYQERIAKNKKAFAELFSPNLSNNNQAQNFDSSQLQIYNASSRTTYLFFEASANYMSALELLNRAYGENKKADELKAQIAYNKNSKFTEAQKLQSTRSIIDTSSAQIKMSISDQSQILSELGRGYYEQSIPYAMDATFMVYELFITIKNTAENVTQSQDLLTGLVSNLNEVVGLTSVLPEFPTFAKNMIDTTKLILNGANTKKIKETGSMKKALDELNLDV